MYKKLFLPIICLLVFGIFCGCFEKSGNAEIAVNTEIPRNVDVFDMIPDNYIGFAYVNKNILKEEENPFLKNLGVDVEDTNYIISAYSESSAIIIVDGNFNLKNFKEFLNEKGYEKDSYKGVEIYKTKSPLGKSSVAVIGNKIVFGLNEGVENCIDTIVGNKKSILNMKDIAEIKDMVSGGDMYSIARANKENKYNATCFGVGIKYLDNNTVYYKIITKYKNENSAKIGYENALKNIEIEKEDGFYDINAKRDGLFVIMESKINKDNLTKLT
ncbi:hypothetical protein [Methanotorris formicicus]|uniref:Uncharacterized protein n=1 Tax=Methanotorris formicicus Mc-S-70 TaxID=647171 RepID=H1KYL1_9EURY|nr:hypothetical protein [Methanotorris formicicus]EHP87051.1 hypothetical protein MetfoDRAFT_0884 [Methanotorris formicicus Mc-S-70]